MKRSLILSVIAVTLTLSSDFVMAEDKAMSKDKLETTPQEAVRGSQLITREEREEFRNKMRSANSAEERQQIQQEQHERMRSRAEERGLSMPNDPPADGGLKTQKQDRVYGSQLMTQQEREEFRNKMRSANSAEERQQIQQEHHERMKLRAKERGLNMPDNPPADGMGMGKGMGGRR